MNHTGLIGLVGNVLYRLAKFACGMLDVQVFFIEGKIHSRILFIVCSPAASRLLSQPC
jgi:hypothetical protein